MPSERITFIDKIRVAVKYADIFIISVNRYISDVRLKKVSILCRNKNHGSIYIIRNLEEYKLAHESMKRKQFNNTDFVELKITDNDKNDVDNFINTKLIYLLSTYFDTQIQDVDTRQKSAIAGMGGEIFSDFDFE